MKGYFQTSLEEEDKEWDKRVEELKQHFASIENEMIERQKQELYELHDKLDKSLPSRSKPSSALLNLKAVQQNLVKQKKYAEANDAKLRAQTMEAEEEKKWAQVRDEKIAYQEALLMQKHNKEREAHAKRAETALDELDIERKKKTEQLIQNYNNTKKQTSNVHKIEMAQMSKYEKRSSPTSKAMNEADLTESTPN